jgi:hypothetical protein
MAAGGTPALPGVSRLRLANGHKIQQHNVKLFFARVLSCGSAKKLDLDVVVHFVGVVALAVWPDMT